MKCVYGYHHLIWLIEKGQSSKTLAKNKDTGSSQVNNWLGFISILYVLIHGLTHMAFLFTYSKIYSLRSSENYVSQWASTIAWPRSTGFTSEFSCLPQPRYSGQSLRNVKNRGSNNFGFMAFWYKTHSYLSCDQEFKIENSSFARWN